MVDAKARPADCYARRTTRHATALINRDRAAVADVKALLTYMSKCDQTILLSCVTVLQSWMLRPTLQIATQQPSENYA